MSAAAASEEDKAKKKEERRLERVKSQPVPKDPKTLGGIIRRARVRAGLTQRALADKLGTYQNLVNRWENDRVIPRFVTLTKFADLVEWDDKTRAMAFELAAERWTSKNRYFPQPED